MFLESIVFLIPLKIPNISNTVLVKKINKNPTKKVENHKKIFTNNKKAYPVKEQSNEKVPLYIF